PRTMLAPASYRRPIALEHEHATSAGVREVNALVGTDRDRLRPRFLVQRTPRGTGRGIFPIWDLKVRDTGGSGPHYIEPSVGVERDRSHAGLLQHVEIIADRRWAAG